MDAPRLEPTNCRRIIVVGTSGSGKTTLATRLARHWSLPYIELDALYWGPGWTPATPAAFRARVAAAIAGERWIVDGNYSVARDLLWSRADTLVWLDYPLGVNLWRLLLRSTRRIVTREALWNGNRETFRETFLSRESLIIEAWRTHGRRRHEFPTLLHQPAYSHLTIVRHHTPQATRRWLTHVR